MEAAVLLLIGLAASGLTALLGVVAANENTRSEAYWRRGM